jgi:hypothetical protein
MWTLQVWVIDLPQPLVLSFKTKEKAEAARKLIWASKGAEVQDFVAVEDDYGREADVPPPDCIGGVELIDDEKFQELRMEQALIQHRRQTLAQQQAAGRSPIVFPMQGRAQQ